MNEAKAEELARDFFGKQILSIMQNKEAIIKELIGILQEQQRIEGGLSNFIDALDSEDVSTKTQLKIMKTLCKSMKSQANAIRQLSMSSIVYISGGDFSKDCAMVADKMGYGKEAFQTMFNDKFKRA